MNDADKELFYGVYPYPGLLEDATMVVMEAIKYNEDLPDDHLRGMIEARMPGGTRSRAEADAREEFIRELVGQLQNTRDLHEDLVRTFSRYDGDRRSEWDGCEWDPAEPIDIVE